MDKHGLGQLELKDGETEINLVKSGQQESSQPVFHFAPGAMPAAAAVPGAVPGAPAPAREEGADTGSAGMIEVRSPCVGTFYRAPSPDAENFVEDGDPVEPDSTVCIVEAMKVLNEVKAEHHGVIKKILVENGAAVEYDQVLMLIAP
jgi:acetyl-CoA carboxylase biotin carboxyl carrier protein